MVLASTTSTEDSGLFEILLPAFERAHPQYRIQLIAVGSGQALELGRRGDADVLLVHSPEAEQAFMGDGHGVRRDAVMSNDFLIVGPASDPADIRARDPAEALRRIANRGAAFVSRGDSSGTHHAELDLWRRAGVQPPPEAGWYLQVGQGMGDALMIASERGAYTLTDAATYRFLADALALVVLSAGGAALENPYSVIPVTGARNAEGAEAFARWITSAEAQALIGAYATERFGSPLFRPIG